MIRRRDVHPLLLLINVHIFSSTPTTSDFAGTGGGFDFSGLEIGHLGHIYEGLLSLRLSVADRDYRYDARVDRYVAAEPDEQEVGQGELLWLTDEGGRKGGGVYYTPEASFFLVYGGSSGERVCSPRKEERRRTPCGI